MEQAETKSELFAIFYDNGEMGKHQVKSISEENFQSIQLAQEHLDSKGYFQLNENNPHHFVKDSTHDFSLAIIVNL